jgi:hypothetical protein
MFSDVTMEARIAADHPLPAIRALTDTALRGTSRRLGGALSSSESESC